MRARTWTLRLVAVACAVLCALVLLPVVASASQEPAASGPEPEYQTLDELTGKQFAYVNGSVYNQYVQKRVQNTGESFYASLPDCVAAVEGGKADAAVQLSYCCQAVVNRKGGTVALLPENVGEVEEAFFFPKGDPLIPKFNEEIQKLEKDGTIDELTKKWVGTDESAKTLPNQDWDAPNGTLKFATSGVLDPFSYVGANGEILGYDVDLALHIAKDLGYHLDISTITMDAIFASVQTGKVDFGGTLTKTPERAEMVDFTEKVMPTYISVIVKSKDGGQASGAANSATMGRSFIDDIKQSFIKTFVQENRWELILSGLGVTAIISLCSGSLGTLLGYVFVTLRRKGNKLVGKLIDGYQAIIGGVPIVVVLMVLYYVVFGSTSIPGEIVAILAFTLSFGSTASTTMWTAIKGIDIGQEESGLALGYEKRAVFRKIVLPQAAQQFLPQLISQFVGLVKETAVVGYIAVQDLTRASDLIRARTMDAFFPLVSTAIIYFVLCRLIAHALNRLADRINPTSKPRKIRGVK